MNPWIEVVIVAIIGAVGGGTLATLLKRNLGAIIGIILGGILGAFLLLGIFAILRLSSKEQKTLEQVLLEYAAISIFGALIGAYHGAKHLIKWYAMRLADPNDEVLATIVRLVYGLCCIVGSLIGILNSDALSSALSGHEIESPDRLAVLLAVNLSFFVGVTVAWIMYESTSAHEAEQRDAIARMVKCAIETKLPDDTHNRPATN